MLIITKMLKRNITVAYIKRRLVLGKTFTVENADDD